MGENFKISVEKACPACSTNCPELELELIPCYGDGKVVIRDYYCAKRDICKNLWAHLMKYKKA